MLFKSTKIVATRGAIQALMASDQILSPTFLDLHFSGDWGSVPPEDRLANNQALVDGSRIMSAYETTRGVKLWVITDAVGDDGERESTCILLPEEY